MILRARYNNIHKLIGDGLPDSTYVDIVRNNIADAEVYVSTDEDTDGVYSDKLVQLVQAEDELLDILAK